MDPDGKKAILKYPYPYKAMLAICSDLDETPNREVYWESSRFLNTAENTSMGKGVNLEVGNTIYFNMPRNQFSYWNTDDRGRAMVHAMIQSGHIDCLHSYGDYATHRGHVQKAIAAMNKKDCKLEVWIDHAVAPTNLGSDIMNGSGDVVGSIAYHTDLSIPFGIKYVWRGRVTSIIGQENKRSLSGIFKANQVKYSFLTINKELAKIALSKLNNKKYSIHKTNSIFRKIKLRDDQNVIEFIRSNPHWGGVSCGDNAQGISEVLNHRVLSQLVKRNGVCILYTHLGKIQNISVPFNASTCEAFRRLSAYYNEKKILVTSTRKLLGYLMAIKELKLTTRQENERTMLEIEYSGPEEDLCGLSIYTKNPEGTILKVNNKNVSFIKYNENSHEENAVISIPWKRNEFPDL